MARRSRIGPWSPKAQASEEEAAVAVADDPGEWIGAMHGSIALLHACEVLTETFKGRNRQFEEATARLRRVVAGRNKLRDFAENLTLLAGCDG